MRKYYNKTGSEENLTSKVFIGNLDSRNVTREGLYSEFSKYGNVAYVKIFSGYGFVQFEKRNDALQALNATGTLMGNKRIEVQFAKRRKRPQMGSNGGTINKPYNHYGGSQSSFGYNVKVPLFVFNKNLQFFAKNIEKVMNDVKIKVDIYFVTKEEMMLKMPNEKYLLYVFERNEQPNTISFCCVRDNGTTPGFFDTPVYDVAKFIQKDYAKSPQSFKILTKKNYNLIEKERYKNSNQHQHHKRQNFNQMNRYPHQQHQQQQQVINPQIMNQLNSQQQMGMNMFGNDPRIQQNPNQYFQMGYPNPMGMATQYPNLNFQNMQYAQQAQNQQMQSQQKQGSHLNTLLKNLTSEIKKSL